ncbi:MAG: transketolase, partial [Clostridia bacterium]|nr:transketolase [Clostridia bacterium]
MEPNIISNLNKKADLIRKMCIECIAHFGVGHIGGSSSIIELLTALYFKCANVNPKEPHNPDRDRIVLSKGHAAPALYSTLAAKGYFDKQLLLTLNQNGTTLPSHADMLKVTGVDFTAGSLGQGISAAVGMAICGKMDRKKFHTYAIVGDGESQEGQVWEALMLAGSRKLNNFTVIVDNNKMQIDGMTADVCKVEPFESKLKAFGFKTYSIDGHDMESIVDTIEKC